MLQLSVRVKTDPQEKHLVSCLRITVIIIINIITNNAYKNRQIMTQSLQIVTEFGFL